MNHRIALLAAAHLGAWSVLAAQNVMISDVPDYSWYAGCWGTASGNIMGYWDRHGLPDFYTGPTGDGVAPLNSVGSNQSIRSMWASKAGVDGRPVDQPGHIDDYFTNGDENSYESTAPDPYKSLGRAEHSPDCLGDFMGASQNKWGDLDGECSGNIDAFAFNYWDHSGHRRVNFTPPPSGGIPGRDVQSGIRTWAKYRGYDAEVSSQLADFNPEVQPGNGFTFEDLKAEIDNGYPVLLMLQNPGELFRNLPGMPRGNPEIHAMLAYGYVTTDDGQQIVRYRTSWGSGDNMYSIWGPDVWQAGMTLRGVLLFHPAPKITKTEVVEGGLKISWDGPSSTLIDNTAGASFPTHWYGLEKEDDLNGEFTPAADPVSDLEITVSVPYPARNVFFRVKVMTPEQAGKPRGQ
ncbi:MAG TPA: hypothetical protein VGR78_19435 [Verrucomicrobiae bacterium]|jgi:hypothetical protein|nr:hypothetical protein [Verrucomicrobiae bacterium]